MAAATPGPSAVSNNAMAPAAASASASGKPITITSNTTKKTKPKTKTRTRRKKAPKPGSEGPSASKPCHNCRRRRLRCDRSFPHCSKCASHGTECLGYGQLFLWTGAVASRGKLAGRTSSASLYKRVDLQEESDSDDLQGEGEEEESQSRGQPPSQEADETPSDTLTERSQSGSPPDEDAPLVTRDASESRLVRAPSRHARSRRSGSGAGFDLTPHWVLVDPLYQDMKYSHRQYLAYFSTRVCPDLVATDVPDRNAFRDLLPLTPVHPILQQVIIATAAAHMCNQSRALTGKMAPGPWLMDALVAKQNALQMMPAAVDSIDTIDGDVLLAAALFLVNIELIESGKTGWKAHLEGAGRIMSMIEPLKSADETLRNYIMSDCLVYYILSSAFHAAAPDLQTYFQSCHTLSILEKTANSYYCCPPEVLEILLLASQVSHQTAADGLTESMLLSAGAALLQRAQAVDILEWARQVRDIPALSHTSVGSRFRAGSAHRLAACLYILQAVPALHGWLGDEVVEVLHEDFLHSLESIPPADPNFKATAWPTFIFGASARTPERQAWVMNRLRQLALICPWGYLYSAMETLQALWALEAEGKLTKSWLQTLRDPDFNFLIV